MIRCRVEGDALHSLAEEAMEDLAPRLMRAAADAAEILKQRVLDQLARRGQPTSGAPPAFVSGDLFRSIETVAARRAGSAVTSGARTTHPAAAVLEFGGTTTQDGKVIHHPPYPYWRPAEAAARPQIETRLDEL